MRQSSYDSQVRLLLDIMPAVSAETCFAMHGGTAINLFVRDMPRLSVDIDLTYVPIEDRATSVINIAAGLSSIERRIHSSGLPVRTEYDAARAKIRCATNSAEIKIEVNTTMRGTLSAPELRRICKSAELKYDRFTEVQTVPLGQLYGGKTCAALARQHPRDLFDIRQLLDNEGFTPDIKRGFLLCVLSSDKPITDVLRPTLLDQRDTIENKFAGMTELPFTYEAFEETRQTLIATILSSLDDNDREFLLSFKAGDPEWSKYAFEDFEQFPGVQWKLRNIRKLRDDNPINHKRQANRLRDLFY